MMQVCVLTTSIPVHENRTQTLHIPPYETLITKTRVASWRRRSENQTSELMQQQQQQQLPTQMHLICSRY